MQIASKIRQDLMINLNFVRLISSLLPPDSGGGIFNPVVQKSIDETVEFVNTAYEKQIITQGPKILNALEPLLKNAISNFPPKKELSVISKLFNTLLKEEPEIFSFGIPFFWLDAIIDTKKLYNYNIPYQARIGTGRHAGNWSLEEMYFLGDGFFFLIKAEKELELLLSLGNKLQNSVKDGYPSQEAYLQTNTIKLNTCSYGRNSILNLYSFLECFINGVAYDFYLRNKNALSEIESEILQGKKSDKYISLEYKLEKYPTIIRQDHKQIIFVNDIKQLKEPFITLINECKELRDSSMHFSPNKEAIWRKPTDWVEKAKKYSIIILESARCFWKACYPEREYPSYFLELDYKKCFDKAEIRFAETKEIKSTSDETN